MSDKFLLAKQKFEEGLFFINHGSFDLAEKKFSEILKEFPERLSILTNLLIAKIKLKKFDESEQLINKILKISPKNVSAKFYSAVISGEQGYFLDSLNKLNCLTSKSDLEKNFLSEILTYKGVICSKLGYFKEALLLHENALHLDINNITAKWNLSLSYLLNKELEKGFELYEVRFLKNKSKISNSAISVNELYNKKILILGEQGFGDIIQFSRYIPLLKKFTQNISFLPPKELKEVFSFSEIKIVSKFKNSDYDFIIPLLSLPFLFKTNIKNIPSSNYLNFKKTNNSLDSKNRFKIGLAWSGRENYPYDFLRSIPLKFLKNIYELNHDKFQFYCLQKDIRESDKFFFEKSNMIYLGDKNFYDLANLILEMDLVISSDTSILHLSSTLQKKTFGLISFCPDWRWFLSDLNSPWYENLKLFRCKSNNNWLPVIDSVVEELSREFI